ncbi:MAG TPA: PEGA domain-containing protein [Polyangiaceae bacterium]
MIGSAGALAAALALSQVSPALAEELTDALAISFKDEGDRAVDEGNYAKAVRAYTKGDRIQHHPSFDFNLARALQGLGRLAEALDYLERFDQGAPADLRANVPGLDELMAQLRRSVGIVIFEGAPRTATVTANGRYLGAFAPGKPMRSDLGTVELRVEADGYEPIVSHAQVSADHAVTVRLDWVPVDNRATLTIVSSVPATQVSVDGRRVGQTPVEVKVAAGRHRLLLEHPDHPSLETGVVARVRESRRLTLEMPGHPALWTRWWFWTGATAVVTGIIVTSVALSTSKSPHPGDIEPGVVSSDLVIFH